jgi:hypothetical protein
MLANDLDLHAANRDGYGGPDARAGGPSTGAAPPERLAALSERRRKLLELYYGDKISAQGFAEEEGRITTNQHSLPLRGAGALLGA